MRQVRPAAQVHKLAAAVQRHWFSLWDTGQHLQLELVLAEHLCCELARHLQALERLPLLHEPLHEALQRAVVSLRDALLASQVHLIEKPALFQRRSVAQQHVVAVVCLQRLAKHVRGAVPEHGATLRSVEAKQLQLQPVVAGFKLAAQIQQSAACVAWATHPGDHRSCVLWICAANPTVV